MKTEKSPKSHTLNPTTQKMNWKKILIGKWSWKRPFISLFSVYILLAVFAISCADSLIFPAPPSSYEKTLPGLKILETPGADPIAAIHLPAPKGRPTILYSHGNAEDLNDSRFFYQRLQASGLGVFAYDYPGYGQSSGKPSEDGCYRAIEAAWNELIASGTDPKSIFILGRSVGSGPSVWLASKKSEAAGLILISPFKSAYTTGIPLPFPIFPGDRFPNSKRIKKIDLPLLVIHGEQDRVIRPSHGKALVENSPAQEKRYVPIEQAGHNDLFQKAEDHIIGLITSFCENQHTGH